MKPGLICAICNHYEKYNLKKYLEVKHNLNTKEYKKLFSKSRTMTGHSKRTPEYWYYRGYTWEDSLKQVKFFQGTSKKQYILGRVEEGYSKEEAQSLWNEKQARNSYRSLKYYTSRGKTKEEALKERSKKQSELSKKSSKFKGKTHSKESRKRIRESIKKQIEKESESRAKRFYKKNKGTHVSKEEVCCYLELKKIFSQLKANLKIGTRTVDMSLGNLIIKYYGDFWHRNPKLYKSDFYKNGYTSEEI